MCLKICSRDSNTESISIPNPNSFGLKKNKNSNSNSNLNPFGFVKFNWIGMGRVPIRSDYFVIIITSQVPIGSDY